VLEKTMIGSGSPGQKVLTALLGAAALSLLVACGGGGGGGGAGGGAGAITFSSSATASVAEKTTGAFYTAAVTGAAGATTFSIGGGADAARFAITSAGALSFVAAPDFEAPTDANRDNAYLVTIGVSDGTNSGSLSLTVNVTDVAGTLAIRRVGAGFAQPLFVTGTGDNSGRLFVVQKAGLIRILDPATGTIASTPFLDVASQLNTDFERGLLGLALAPDFATSGRFYINMINTAANTEIRTYRTLAGNAQADVSTMDVILQVIQPSSTNHKGGWLGFDANNLLYIALGDGGFDPAQSQNVNSNLGKILRIDPRTDAFPADPLRDYTIPAGNPFATAGGNPEIFARGLRNPFRNSFDRQTGNLYIGDVGELQREEINLVRAGTDVGLNFGWNILEGTTTFAGGSTVGLTPPVAEYPHGTGQFQGNSVTGGYVYRGPVAQFRGQYVFGDFVRGRVWTIPVASLMQGTTFPNTSFTDRTASFAPDVGLINNVSSFGEDDFGNLFIADFDGDIFMLREND
jgi:glucose/arabinose dehydrogenase